MVEHRRMRGRRIAGEDRLHHGGMFGVRARRAPVGAELRAAEGRESATKAGGDATVESLFDAPAASTTQDDILVSLLEKGQ